MRRRPSTTPQIIDGLPIYADLVSGSSMFEFNFKCTIH
jgi:hypothetical protein